MAEEVVKYVITWHDHEEERNRFYSFRRLTDWKAAKPILLEALPVGPWPWLTRDANLVACLDRARDLLSEESGQVPDPNIPGVTDERLDRMTDPREFLAAVGGLGKEGNEVVARLLTTYLLDHGGPSGREYLKKALKRAYNA